MSSGFRALGKQENSYLFAQATISRMKQNNLILDLTKDIFDPVVNFKGVCLYRQTLKEAVEEEQLLFDMTETVLYPGFLNIS